MPQTWRWLPMSKILFLIYAADLKNVISSPCCLYADDTKFFNNPLRNHDEITQDLNNIVKWADLWKIPLNLSKCVVLHMGSNNSCIEYTLHNVTLSAVDEHLDLGVLINSQLSWSNQVARASKQANKMLYLIFKAFKRPSPALVSKLYKTYVRPHLEFAISVWNPLFIRNIELLENPDSTHIYWKHPWDIHFGYSDVHSMSILYAVDVRWMFLGVYFVTDLD